MSKVVFVKLFEFPDAQVIIRTDRDNELEQFLIITETQIGKYSLRNTQEVEDEEHLDMMFNAYEEEDALNFLKEARRQSGFSFQTRNIRKSDLN